MKKILLSIATVALVSVVAVKATGAFFTDSDVSNNNTFTSGNFEIQVNGNANDATDPDHFSINLGTVTGLMPGDKTAEATIDVKNVSSNNAAVFGRFTLSDTSEDDLSKALRFYLYKVDYFDESGNPTLRWPTTIPYYGTASNEDWFIEQADYLGKWFAVGGKTNLYQWVTGDGPLDVPGTSWDMEGMKPNAHYVLHFQLQMDPAASNTYQGKTVTLGYEVKSTQIDTAAIVGLGLGGSFNDSTYVNTFVTPYLNNFGL